MSLDRKNGLMWVQQVSIGPTQSDLLDLRIFARFILYAPWGAWNRLQWIKRNNENTWFFPRKRLTIIDRFEGLLRDRWGHVFAASAGLKGLTKWLNKRKWQCHPLQMFLVIHEYDTKRCIYHSVTFERRYVLLLHSEFIGGWHNL